MVVDKFSSSEGLKKLDTMEIRIANVVSSGNHRLFTSGPSLPYKFSIYGAPMVSTISGLVDSPYFNAMRMEVTKETDVPQVYSTKVAADLWVMDIVAVERSRQKRGS